MKSHKKSVIYLLIMTLLIGTISGVTGCGKDEVAEGSISQSEWLSMINETFGMYSYDSETPYIKEVKQNDPYFSDVQIAYEWGLIDEKNFEPKKSITKDFVARTLVDVVGKDSTKDLKANQITQLAYDEGYVTFSYAGKSDGKHIVTKDEAIMSLGASKEKWLDFDFEDKAVMSTKDDVENLVDKGLTGLDCQYDEESNCLKIPEDYAGNLSSGTTYVAPAMSDSSLGIGSTFDVETGTENDETEYENITAPEEADTNNQNGEVRDGTNVGYVLPAAYTVDHIDYSDGYAYVYNKEDAEVELEDIVDEMEYSGSDVTPDFSTLPIVDALGNRIYADDSTASVQTYQVRINENDEAELIPLKVDLKGSSEIELDGVKLKLEVKKDKVTASISYENKPMTFTHSSTISNLSTDFNINVFDLKNATAVTHFDTKIEDSVKVSYKKEGLVAPEYSNGNGKFFSNFKRSVLKDSKAKGAKSIKICSIPIVGKGVYLGLDLKLKFSVDGSISLVQEMHNDFGIKCKNGKPQVIHNVESKGKEVDIKTNAKGTLYVGLGVVGLGKTLVGAGFDLGVGASYEQKMYLVDNNNKLLETCSVGNSDEEAEVFLQSSPVSEGHVDRCSDLSVYWIFEFGMDETSEIFKFMKMKNELKVVILGKDNAKIDFLCGHWEDGKKVDKCTRNYSEDEEESVMSGDTLEISYNSLNLKPGSSQKINIKTLPKDYSISDIKVSTSDDKVATIDSDGTVSAVAPGSAVITFEIEGTSFKQACKVRVQGDAQEQTQTFEPITNDKINQYVENTN